MITLVPDGGLCNRMRAVASAQRVAELHGKKLLVEWHRMPDLNCAFSDLFDCTALPFSVRECNSMGPWTAWSKASMLSKERLFPLLGVAVTNMEESARFLKQPQLLEPGLKAGKWYVRSFSKLIDGPGIFGVLRPSAVIQSTIDAYGARLRKSVAVHIRRTDNANSIRRSPLSAFIELMRNELSADASASFYVATDSPETLQQLTVEFGEKVFSHPKRSLRRDDPQAIFDAMVDLYSLASCRRLIGSYWSSFTDTAAELYGIPHVIVDVG